MAGGHNNPSSIDVFTVVLTFLFWRLLEICVVVLIWFQLFRVLDFENLFTRVINCVVCIFYKSLRNLTVHLYLNEPCSTLEMSCGDVVLRDWQPMIYCCSNKNEKYLKHIYRFHIQKSLWKSFFYGRTSSHIVYAEMCSFDLWCVSNSSLLLIFCGKAAVLEENICGREEWDIETVSEKRNGYVSQSAVALRCQIKMPPCIRNPYLNESSEIDGDPFGNHRSKHAGIHPATIGGVGFPRYRSDFHEIERIGNGNFSCVFKVLNRIDGCMYAVKCSTKQLQKDIERRKALMEVQAMASLGSHQNIVRYYTSWFEDDHLYIQMELCEHSLSMSQSSKSYTEEEVLEALHQIAKALQYMHGRGIAHLDVKPDNIYVVDGIYKLGDFGCSSLLDKSLPIEEGDARYMPQEILNEQYDHLEKVDIFSLGVTIYELVRGSALPESGNNFMNLREGKMPLLPGHSMPFQNLLKVMMDPDPVRRPCANDIVKHPIFDRLGGSSKIK